ncbi:hypothetical protein LOK49_LG06G02704 [Camellia lanceoleosa]|uniref:Uncharacterized protein n=1 Tax=Camellia lanceoleosa TaxID=1840588 RepID=A0ACC0HG16_9ERIC|nr:hypothetical protein LOK49_LG06G02704 [Camellia lanceoleosa]
MAIDCVWHDHPLQLRSIPTDTLALCFVCCQPLSGYHYRCPDCTFFLHISCLKLPLQSLHPLHLPHPLSLLPNPPPNPHNNNPQILCTHCQTPCSGFTYHCSLCSFTLHLHCASQRHHFKLEIHHHPLAFSVSPPNGFESFRCNVCGDFGYGFNLGCVGCEFFVHIECSALPVFVKSPRHRHPFSLTSIRSIDDGTDEYYCDIVCEGEVNPKGSVYYCAKCNYMAHLGCLTSAPKPCIKFSYRDVDVSSSQSVNQSNTQMDQIGFDNGVFNHPSCENDDENLTKLSHHYAALRAGNESSEVVGEIVHFSHQQHPLVLNDLEKNEKNGVICRGCWGQILGFAYSCSQCNFFLHRWCAELPPKIQHPIHPNHTLTLIAISPSPSYQCNACSEPCDGFTFNCKICSFNLHAMCASIPSTIITGIHNHPLFLRQKRPYLIKCNACRSDCSGTVFECERCALVLDFKCALLPHKVRHKCHIDPLALTYVPVPVDDDSDEFYCDACEELRDPNHWVYYCADCEFSAHMTCVVSELLGGPPSKGLIQFDHHEHLLSLITKPPFNSS